MTKQESLLRLGARATALGLTPADLATLIRAERVLHRWAEMECGDGNAHRSWAIERDPDTDIPYLVVHPHHGASFRTKIADKEARAKARIAAVLARHPGLVAVYQGDPRGCVLSIVRLSDVPDGTPDFNWASYGMAVAV